MRDALGRLQNPAPNVETYSNRGTIQHGEATRATCIEEGCKRKVRPRENWHTMSEEYALMASAYHHRCNLCYVRWLCVTGGSKLTRANNKEYFCEGCARLIQKGEHYRLAFRKAFLRALP